MNRVMGHNICTDVCTGKGMASIYRIGKKWRAQVSIKGSRVTEVFQTKQQAAAWAMDKEAQGKGGKMPIRSLGDALERYAKEVAPAREGALWESIRCKALGRHKVANILLRDISRSDLATWRDDRLKTVKPATVLRDINLLRAVFGMCRGDWQWMRDNPIKGLGLPEAPPSRRRRVTPKEIEALRIAFDLDGKLEAKTKTQRTGLAFLLALETAMRSGEMIKLTWPHVDLRRQFVHLPKTKNGDARDVPLSKAAVVILRTLPREADTCFAINDRQRDSLWRKVAIKAGVVDLHFHDSRAEAIWALSKKLDVLQLARVTGHRDIRSLMFYYNESAEDMAKRLD